jgi:hypothetical protein
MRWTGCADGYTAKEEDTATPSPTRYAHINLYRRPSCDLALTGRASVARTDGRYGRG